MGGDEAPGFQVIADRQRLFVRRGHKPMVRLVLWSPLPHRPNDRHEEGFHRPRGDVDQEALDLPGCDRLQVFGHGVDMPAVNVGCARFKDVPGAPNEPREAFLAIEPVKFPKRRLRVAD